MKLGNSINQLLGGFSVWLTLAIFPCAKLVGGTSIIQVRVSDPSASNTVSVSINADSPGAAIPADFTGLSFEAAQLLPDANGIHYFQPDNVLLIQMFRTLGVRSLRIGGNTSDRDARKLPGPADWDDLFAFARAADVKVIYGLKLYQGNPQVAAQTVKYLMDHYASLIDCFAIGQEPSAYPADAEDNRPANERMGPGAENFRYQSFATEWRRFANVIHALVPNARFCGPDVHNNGKWTSQFIEDFGQIHQIALITAHLYAGGAGNKVTMPEAGRDQMLSDRFIQTYQKLYDGFVPLADSRDLPYRLDEVNSFYNGGAAEVSDTFASALWGLDFMHWWAEHGAAGLNFHTGDQVAAGPNLRPAHYAVFISCPNGYQAHPLAYALKAFELGAHGRILPVTITNPQRFNLAAYATLDDKGMVYVTLINKEHGEHARAARVSLWADGGSFREGQIVYLKSSPLGVAATKGETLGGAGISAAGDFTGQWKAFPAFENAPAADACKVEVPASSAAVLKLRLNRQEDMSFRR